MSAQMRFERNPRIDADVELLLGRFRDLVPDGRTILHEEVESLLRIPRTAGRYKTVTTKWRRVILQETRVFLDGRAAQGRGFKVLTPDEMVRYGNREVRAIGRRVRKAILITGLPNPTELSTNELRSYQARLMVACEQIGSAHKRVLFDLTQALRPPAQLPRRAG